MKTTLLIYEVTLSKIVNFITYFKVTIPSVMSSFAVERRRDKGDSSQSGDIGSLTAQAPRYHHSTNYQPSICTQLQNNIITYILDSLYN